MSDSDFRPKRFLYMPASAAAALAKAPPVPGQLSWFSLNRQYIFDWFNIWRQYTWQSPWTHRAMRTEPFENMLLSCVFSSVFRQIFSNHIISYHIIRSFWGWGEEPFAMERASQCIEDLANNVLGRYSLLDVSLLLVSIHVPRIISAWLCFASNFGETDLQCPRCMPCAGPAVGLGMHAQPRFAGEDLEAVLISGLNLCFERD